METISFILVGAVVGFVVGLTGVGGGALMTPALIYLFNVSTPVAIGTDLLYAAITKSAGIFVHHKQKTIIWSITLLLLAGSIPGSIATHIALQLIDHGAFSEQLMRTTLGVMLVITACVILFKDFLKRFSSKPQPSLLLDHEKVELKPKLTIITGFILGIIVTLSSVGAGAICAAVLMFLYPRLPAVKVVGTDLAHAIPLTLIAGLGHSLEGHLDVHLLFTLLIGSLPGIFIGSRIGTQLPDALLRPGLATLLLFIGLKLSVY